MAALRELRRRNSAADISIRKCGDDWVSRLSGAALTAHQAEKKAVRQAVSRAHSQVLLIRCSQPRLRRGLIDPPICAALVPRLVRR